jgi:hypothetical protein
MSLDSTTADDLKESILKDLREINDSEDLGLRNISLPGIDFKLIIKHLASKYKTQVVVLIDEYDSPVSDNINNAKLALENRDVLKTFYSGFKDADDYIRFVFVTGVTRYAFMGLSAGLNHLEDISLDPDFGGICGFTLDEFDDLFKKHLAATFIKMKENGHLASEATLADLREKIFKMYDGYSGCSLEMM